MNDDRQERRDDALPPPGDVTSTVATNANADCRVGYKHPPKHTQFKPGQSGNPHGRPEGVKSVSDLVHKIVRQKVTVTENGRKRRVSRLEAILLRAASEASRGDARALRLWLQLIERYGEGGQSGAERETSAAEDMAILRRYLPDLDEVFDAEASGITDLSPPDDR